MNLAVNIFDNSEILPLNLVITVPQSLHISSEFWLINVKLDLLVLTQI